MGWGRLRPAYQLSILDQNKYEKYGQEVGKESYNFAKKYFDHMYLGKLKSNTYDEWYIDSQIKRTNEVIKNTNLKLRRHIFEILMSTRKKSVNFFNSLMKTCD